MTTIKIKQLNNKGRKGTYLYIKETGKRGRYYKYHPQDSVEGIYAYHKDKVKKGTIKQYKETYGNVIKGIRGSTSKLRTKALRYKRKKLVGLSLNNNMQKGIGEVLIKEMRLITNKELQEKKEELLENIVLDKELRALIATEENMKKLSHRIEHKLRFLDNKGNQLDSIDVFSKTPEDVKSILQSRFKNGTLIETDSKTTWQSIVTESRLGKNNPIKEGKLSRIEARILFRKN